MKSIIFQEPSKKRKRPPPKPKQMDTPSLLTPSANRSSSFTPTVGDKTKSRLAAFNASDVVSSVSTINIFQVYQYFTIYRQYFLLKFEQYSWISYTTFRKSGGTKDQFRRVKVPGTAPYWKACTISFQTPDRNHYISPFCVCDMVFLSCLSIRRPFTKVGTPKFLICFDREIFKNWYSC